MNPVGPVERLVGPILMDTTHSNFTDEGGTYKVGECTGRVASVFREQALSQ